jgi:frataxin-like iron-binding protein CyaY
MNQKELKEAYKQTKQPAGVFQIRNTVNGKIFIGSSTTLNTIWNSQKIQLETGNHPFEGLQKDWKAFGGEHFVFEILAEHEFSDQPFSNPRQELKKLEQMFRDDLQPYGEKGYHTKKD